MTYGKSSNGNYAICSKSNKQHGVWDVVEAVDPQADDGEDHQFDDRQEGEL